MGCVPQARAAWRPTSRRYTICCADVSACVCVSFEACGACVLVGSGVGRHEGVAMHEFYLLCSLCSAAYPSFASLQSNLLDDSIVYWCQCAYFSRKPEPPGHCYFGVETTLVWRQYFGSLVWRQYFGSKGQHHVRLSGLHAGRPSLCVLNFNFAAVQAWLLRLFGTALSSDAWYVCLPVANTTLLLLMLRGLAVSELCRTVLRGGRDRCRHEVHCCVDVQPVDRTGLTADYSRICTVDSGSTMLMACSKGRAAT